MILDFQTGVDKQYNTIDSDYTAIIRVDSLHLLEALLCMVKHSNFRISTANFLGIHFCGEHYDKLHLTSTKRALYFFPASDKYKI